MPTEKDEADEAERVLSEEKCRWFLERAKKAEAQVAQHDAELADLRERCALAAFDAQLPSRFQWGEDAKESFDFGTHRAMLAVRAVPLRKEG